jgi:ABC-type dipeptide/oligopeptide/nickel transport system permease subunit/glycosyltransferase involved in cell wall biosynthesis
MPFLTVTICLLAAYGVLMALYTRAYWSMRGFVASEKSPITKFSVIIPARNEASNIEACIAGIRAQNYPSHLFEIIVVDDFSEDETAQKVLKIAQQHSNVQLLRLQDFTKDENLVAYKKRAIEIAIEKANHPWIVTTDADCSFTNNWLASYDAYIQEHDSVMVAAPVAYTNTGSFLSIFQVLDFISLQGITAAAVASGSHTLCNGANLCYSKEAFERVGKFSGIDHLPSGDDMLLMHKMKKSYPGKIGYLYAQDAVVTTAPSDTMGLFIQQRIRWASKASGYQDKIIFWILLLVYLVNFSLLVYLPINALQKGNINNWLILMGCKTLIEIPFMYASAKFFKQQKLLWWFALMQPFHIVYTVVAGWFGTFGSYTWKGRTVMEQQEGTFFRKLRRNKAASVSLYIVTAAFLMAVFAYFIAPEHSPNANRMIPEIGSMKPGFTIQLLQVKRTNQTPNSSFFDRLINGEEDVYTFIPITSYTIKGSDIHYQKYIDEGITEPGVMPLSLVANNPVIKQTYYAGTDKFGRDMLSRLIIGVRVSLGVGMIAVLLSLTIGILLGALAGFYRGWIDECIMWFINVIWSIPTLLLVFAITLVLGKGFWQVFIAVGLTMWVNVARLVRGQVMAIKNREFIEATSVLGYSDMRTIFIHILPNIIGPVLVIAASNFASAIVIEAGLSFLGVGVQPPQPSWGLMIKENYNFIITHNPALALAPGIAIMMLVLAFNLLGNGLRDAFNVREK